MKKTIYAAALCLLLINCTSHTVNNADQLQLDQQHYLVKEAVSNSSSSFRLWLLFIPFGGKSYKQLEQKAYKRAKGNYDALANVTYTHRKVVLPLIVVTFSIRIVDIEGAAIEYKTAPPPIPINRKFF